MDFGWSEEQARFRDMTEFALEQDVRDSIASRIYSGTSDIQRNIVARLMGL